MNNNNMPGFTALSSVYEGVSHFQTSGGDASLSSAVVPQLMIGGGGTYTGAGRTSLSCTGQCRLVTGACILSCALLSAIPGATAVCLAACAKGGSDCSNDCSSGIS